MGSGITTTIRLRGIVKSCGSEIVVALALRPVGDDVVTDAAATVRLELEDREPALGWWRRDSFFGEPRRRCHRRP
jgi:small ligand-binding sensory domain FIST